MTGPEMIKRTEEFLRRTFDASAYLGAHPEAKAYRLEHTYRVANVGREIAASEGFDETETVIACLLHDIAYCEDFGEDGWREHGRRSAQLARPFLCSLGFAPDCVEDMCCGIAIHVDDGADFPGERTPFALTVGEADNIDRFDAYRIHENLTHDGFLGMDLAEKRSYAKKRLARLRELREIPQSTETARRLWRERLDFYIAFYARLADQLERSGAIVTTDTKSIGEDKRMQKKREEQIVTVTVRTEGEKCEMTDEEIKEWYETNVAKLFDPAFGTPQIAVTLERIEK